MIANLLSSAQTSIERAFGIKNAVVEWQPTQEASHGDFTTTAALRLAKELKKKPQDIAQVIAEDLQKSGVVEKAEVAGAGYVNVWLKPHDLLAGLKQVEASTHYKPLRKKEAPIIIDYSSPNIAKPLGVHHILSTIIGQSISNLYEHDGQPMVRWNYLGDWGTQFGKLAVAYQKWGKGKDPSSFTLDELLELYVQFHNEAEKDEMLEQEGQAAFRKLESGDQELRALWHSFVEVTKNAMAAVYQRLQVSFDLDRGESYYEDKMEPIVEEGKEKGIFTEGEKGALIVEFPEETNMPPAVVMKSDGATLYLTRDLALMRDRVENWHPKAILWAVDVAQQLYFKQLFATAKMLEWELPTLEHIYFGRMRFADKAMSTRKGNILKLEHVLDEAVERATAVIKERGDAIQTDDPQDLAEMMGVGALIYGILSQNRKMDLVFDWDKMLAFEGNSAPYLQYTHARAKSILRKAEGEAGALEHVEKLSDHDRQLVRLLLQFPAALEEARIEHMPHKLANYLYALCQQFNTFYNAEPILKAEDQERCVRLALTALTASVLHSGADLLCLRLPEKM